LGKNIEIIGVEITGPLIRGSFIKRPNRFITIVKIGNKSVRSHLPDPGRLIEILTPGRELYLLKANPSKNRKTDYSTILAKYNGELVSLVSSLPNKFVKECIDFKILSFLKEFELVKPEVVHGNHRFDFLLKDKSNEPFYLEVKSATYVENGIAKFPDAVTDRGKRHVQKLQALVETGFQAGVLFVVQRSDASSFQPMWKRDPKFGTALINAHKAGVHVWCITTRISKTNMTYKEEIPVNLKPI
tara:strand:- start:7 stop:738 length:732 start_codon:yes stop_codon:yes gene_type:complete